MCLSCFSFILIVYFCALLFASESANSVISISKNEYQETNQKSNEGKKVTPNEIRIVFLFYYINKGEIAQSKRYFAMATIKLFVFSFSFFKQLIILSLLFIIVEFDGIYPKGQY